MRKNQFIVISCTLIFLFFASPLLAGQLPALPAAQTVGGYAITARGPDSRAWQRVTWVTNTLNGDVGTMTNSYTELCTGVCYQQGGQWFDSVEAINPVPGGAEAIQGPHQVQWSLNANTPGGAVIVTTPDAKQLSSTVYGLAYYDVATGSNAALAQLQDCNGLIVATNQVVYADAFSNLTADLCYTYTKAGLSQDVVLRQSPPAPDRYGLSDETTVLQVYTEFFNPPPPETIVITNGNSINDQVLDFGDMKMGIGQALFLNGQSAPVTAGSVTKQWVQVGSRTFLIESIPYQAISNQLQQLPQASNLKPGRGSVRRMAFLESNPSRRGGSATEGRPMKLAKAQTIHPRLVVDYNLLSSSGAYTLQGDTTYLVSGPVNFTGILTIEGGTVIKYTNSGAGEISVVPWGTVVCQTGPYRPAVFTSMNDNSAGAQIGGSTGLPSVSSTYLNITLQSTQTLVLRNLRFSYASTAIAGTVDYNGSNSDSITIWDSQFFDCATAFNGDILCDSVSLYLYNVLFSEVNVGVAATTPSGDTLSTSAVNVTADNMGTFAGGTSCSAVNSVFTSVSGFLAGSSFTNCVTNVTSGVYQTVGAGSYYLAAGSPYRNAGTTNINPALLADLQTLTTYPPVIVTGGWFTNDATFFPQAQRDTDIPDIGYHYDPLDYAINICLSNATVTVLPGTALAMFGTEYGVWLYSNGVFNCTGTATSPNYITRYNTVQEQSNTNWESTAWIGSFLAPAQVDTSAASFFFTVWSVLAADYQLNTDTIPCPFGFQDCQFYGGEIYDVGPAIASTNSLYQRVEVEILDTGVAGGISITFCNNLFLNGSLTFKHAASATWTFQDNFFDQTSITNKGGSTINVCGNNAYVTTNYGVLPPENNDVILTNSPAFQVGALGQNYYPATLTNLIHTGSQLAAAAGLYHYTVTTNNVIEGTNIVSIGFHYVAVGTNGLPLDTNGDGIPDYLEDANGNGVVDSGEISWTSSGDLGLTVIITQPANNSQVP